MLFNADVSFEPISIEILFGSDLADKLVQEKELKAVIDKCLAVPGEARLPNDELVPLRLAPAFPYAFEWKSEKLVKVVWSMDLEGARDIAYTYNRALADEAKKSKKEVKKKLSKSVYVVGKILDRLSEKPTGNVEFDKSRLIILDASIQHLKAGLRRQVLFKLNRSLDSWSEVNGASLV